MTREARTLSTPRLEARTFAVGLTAAASHASALAELCNDAASGHPSQRMTLPRCVADAVLHTYWFPTIVPRWLRVVALFTSSTPTIANGATIKLSVSDDTGFTVLFSDPEIPDGLDGGVPYVSGYSTSDPSRLGAGNRQTWFLDVAALVAAGLDDASVWWRFKWVVDVTSPGELESLTVDEVPRFAVDDAEAYGQIGTTAYRPRGLVVDGSPLGLPRLWETARVGIAAGIRTYHGMCRDESDPWLCTSTSFAAFGSDSESAGVAAVYRVRPSAFRPAIKTPVRFVLRYKITGATGGDTATVRLTTGAGTFDATLTDVSGGWAESTVTAAQLDNVAEDRVTWKAKVSNGASTLRLITRCLVDDPAP
jgi:hypothetical protein